MTTVAVVLAMGLLIAACGSSNGGAGTRSSTTAAHAAHASGTPSSGGTSSSASRKPTTKVQAKAFARAVNLRASDVPSFKVSTDHEHEHESAGNKQLEGKLLRCVGASGEERSLLEADSPDFEHETGAAHLGVSSTVDVHATAALANEELAAIHGSRVKACLARYLNLLFKSPPYSSAKVSPVSISEGTPPAPGTTGGFGWRIAARITERGIAIPFNMDILGFVYRSAQVSLFTSGVPQPFPSAAEERLFGLLLERAKTHGV
jgi:hypothetical protein